MMTSSRITKGAESARARTAKNFWRQEGEGRPNRHPFSDENRIFLHAALTNGNSASRKLASEVWTNFEAILFADHFPDSSENWGMHLLLWLFSGGPGVLHIACEDSMNFFHYCAAKIGNARESVKLKTFPCNEILTWPVGRAWLRRVLAQSLGPDSHVFLGGNQGTTTPQEEHS